VQRRGRSAVRDVPPAEPVPDPDPEPLNFVADISPTDARTPPVLRSAAPPPSAPELPRFPGQLGVLLETAPIFRRKLLGYERVQVDSYVAWAEEEMRTQRRATDELVTRFRAVSAELEWAHRWGSTSVEARPVVDAAEQAGRLLAAAADQAAELVAAGAAAADHLVTEADKESAARLDRVREIRTRVLGWCASQRHEAEADRAEARKVLTEARAGAQRLLGNAAQLRADEDRAAEARRAQAASEAAELLRRQADRAQRQRDLADAEAAERRAAVQRELDDLQRLKEQTVGFLRGVDGWVVQALCRLESDADVPAARG
jgi:colicin import membrane protein